MLRYALMNAAHNVARNNRTFGDYYAGKLAQGKSHYNALGHTAHKLVHVIFNILSRNVPFDLPQRLSRVGWRFSRISAFEKMRPALDIAPPA